MATINRYFKMSEFPKILEDLKLQSPHGSLTPVPIYNPNDTYDQQIKFLLKQLHRAKRMHNRKEILLNAWYIGEIVETLVDSSRERTQCLELLSSYYRKTIVRTYYIFEFLGASQIIRTQQTSLTMISRLTVSQYQSLVQESVTIAGARLLEEEVVNP